MVTTVKVTGEAELVRTMDRAAAQLPHLDTEEAAKIIAARSQTTAPRRTGRLAAGTRAARTLTGSTITNPVVYAVPIHWGRPAHNIDPDPWISRAAEQSEREWTAAVEHQGQKICDTVRGA